MGTARARALAVGPVAAFPGAISPTAISLPVWALPSTFVVGFVVGVTVVFY